MDDEGAGRRALRSAGVRDLSLRDAVQGLLEPFVGLLPVDGVSISVVSGPGHCTVGASDPIAARLEQLQYELGEGPHWEALRSGEPVLVPDLRSSRSRWPFFGTAASDLEADAVFSLPLVLDSQSVGVIDLHRSTAGALSPGDVARATSLAAITARTALRLAARSASAEGPADDVVAPELRRVVHQATGMVLVQLDVTAPEAYARLRAHAFATDRSLSSVAHDVVARRLVLGGPEAAE